MTESFILMALGLGIGYSITLGLQRFRAATIPTIGPNTDMQSVAHEATPAWGSHMGTVFSSGGIDKLVRDSGADVVMFVNSNKELIVVDAKTGEPVPEASDLQHGGHHRAEIRHNELGEPVLFDTEKNEAMVRHERTAGDSGFRDSTPISTRIHDARIIYFWQYQGSHCICTWSGGKHYVRCA